MIGEFSIPGLNCGNRFEAESGSGGSVLGKWKVTTDFGELKLSDDGSLFAGCSWVWISSLGILVGGECSITAGRLWAWSHPFEPGFFFFSSFLKYFWAWVLICTDVRVGTCLANQIGQKQVRQLDNCYFQSQKLQLTNFAIFFQSRPWISRAFKKASCSSECHRPSSMRKYFNKFTCMLLNLVKIL